VFPLRLLVEGGYAPSSPGSLASVVGSVGLKDAELREDGSELGAKLLGLLTGDRPPERRPMSSSTGAVDATHASGRAVLKSLPPPPADLSQAARGRTNRSLSEARDERTSGSSPFDSLAAKLGLPTSCDIDLRRQEEPEVTGSLRAERLVSPPRRSGCYWFEAPKPSSISGRIASLLQIISTRQTSRGLKTRIIRP